MKGITGGYTYQRKRVGERQGDTKMEGSSDARGFVADVG